MEDGRYYAATVIPVVDVIDLHLDPNSVSISLNGEPYQSGIALSADGLYRIDVSVADFAGKTLFELLPL